MNPSDRFIRRTGPEVTRGQFVTSQPEAGDAEKIIITLGESDPPSGVVSIGGRSAREFVGWLGLLGAMQELITAVRR
jgi:hypothetical protein